jgi:hypothetical protein
MRPQDRTIIETLAQELSGHTGVRTPAGPIDLITATEAITVTHVRWYEQAIARAQAIRQFLPGLMPRLHCWGTTDPLERAAVFNATQLAVINLTWEEPQA